MSSMLMNILFLLTTVVTSFTLPHNRLHNTETTSRVPKLKNLHQTKPNIEEDVKASLSIPEIFDTFTSFLLKTQSTIISQIEEIDTSGEKFTRDTWGIFANTDDNSEDYDQEFNHKSGSGGITRVIQRGKFIEKGAVSLTVLQNGRLTADRAASIRGRQQQQLQDQGDDIQEGDEYSAAALSLVLHTRSPMVPTFRSDIRIFLVKPKSNGEKVLAWFGGGADLTPYYLFDEDIKMFHKMYRELCENHKMDYSAMKQECDQYFYLPARSEHRGTGGIFFDDLPASSTSMAFVQGVADTWMNSWLPIVNKRQTLSYTDQQRDWQLLRRGRYLEFNLLYDRGVKFGLANANPRVEGVMVSAPPLIAWEYNHVIEEGSEEERLMKILKSPINWA